jgi:hypothetical protein
VGGAEKIPRKPLRISRSKWFAIWGARARNNGAMRHNGFRHGTGVGDYIPEMLKRRQMSTPAQIAVSI